MSAHTLAGRTIAIPETRELDVFAGLLERRGATVMRCPLIAIHDAPNPGPVLEWIERVAAGECDDLLLLTGEGLRRLLSCIDRHAPALRASYIEQLAQLRKITRGPKPERALRELGLRTELAATQPTTDGVIDLLRAYDLRGRRVGVQLYGDDPNLRLLEFLTSAGALALPVAPYVYASPAESQAVRTLAERLLDGVVDAMAFTSARQVMRMFDALGEDLAKRALAKTLIAAVGPVTAKSLADRGVQVSLIPDSSFFLKPLTRALEIALAKRR